MTEARQRSSVISSMTGFARVEGADDGWRWGWEIKSVNGRGMEMRCRLPAGFDRLEPALKKSAARVLSRGNISALLNLQSDGVSAGVMINMPALETAVAGVRRVMETIPCDNPRPEGILALRGVIEADEATIDDASRNALDAALLKSFDEAILLLQGNRRVEGAAMGAVLADQLAQINTLVRDAGACAATTPEAIKDRLKAQLEDLLPADSVPDERIAQEAAILAVKADIREELDRLNAHIEAANALLDEDKPIGRRLDFLTQEFNREANTLCAKANDITLKRIGLDLKSVVDQIREQVQNIE